MDDKSRREISRRLAETGSPASRFMVRKLLKKLSNQPGMEIRIPPYCSKHNPIEHRLFPHITRVCQGVVFHSLAIAKQFMAKAKTTTGLKVTVDILTGLYVTGKKCAMDFIENRRIIFDDYLPRWNYRAKPQFN